MKITLFLTIFLLTNLFANYAYTDTKSQEIDMHGGNTDSLTNNKSSLSNMSSSNLSNLGIKKENANTLKNTKKIKIKKEPKTEKLEEKDFGELNDMGL
jgi:preprotein translocase subunit SecF